MQRAEPLDQGLRAHGFGQGEELRGQALGHAGDARRLGIDEALRDLAASLLSRRHETREAALQRIRDPDVELVEACEDRGLALGSVALALRRRARRGLGIVRGRLDRHGLAGARFRFALGRRLARAGRAGLAAREPVIDPVGRGARRRTPRRSRRSAIGERARACRGICGSGRCISCRNPLPSR